MKPSSRILVIILNKFAMSSVSEGLRTRAQTKRKLLSHSFLEFYLIYLLACRFLPRWCSVVSVNSDSIVARLQRSILIVNDKIVRIFPFVAFMPIVPPLTFHVFARRGNIGAKHQTKCFLSLMPRARICNIGPHNF